MYCLRHRNGRKTVTSPRPPPAPPPPADAPSAAWARPPHAAPSEGDAFLQFAHEQQPSRRHQQRRSAGGDDPHEHAHNGRGHVACGEDERPVAQIGGESADCAQRWLLERHSGSDADTAQRAAGGAAPSSTRGVHLHRTAQVRLHISHAADDEGRARRTVYRVSMRRCVVWG
jgi:hypothetical protein